MDAFYEPCMEMAKTMDKAIGPFLGPTCNLKVCTTGAIEAVNGDTVAEAEWHEKHLRERRASVIQKFRLLIESVEGKSKT